MPQVLRLTTERLENYKTKAPKQKMDARLTPSIISQAQHDPFTRTVDAHIAPSADALTISTVAAAGGTTETLPNRTGTPPNTVANHADLYASATSAQEPKPSDRSTGKVAANYVERATRGSGHSNGRTLCAYGRQQLDAPHAYHPHTRHDAPYPKCATRAQCLRAHTKSRQPSHLFHRINDEA